MITFSLLKTKYKVYYFNDLHNIYLNYKNNFLQQSQYVPTSLTEEIKPGKTLDENAEIDGKKIIVKLIKENLDILKLKKDYDFKNDNNFMLNIDKKFQDYNFSKDFLDNVFVSERESINEVAKGNVEKISLIDFKKYLDLVLLQETYFINIESQYEKLNILNILRCFENFHTHSSKYIDSSSSLTLNLTTTKEKSKYLNSFTDVNLGLDSTVYSGGLFGRDYPRILKSISTVFNVENNNISILSFLVSFHKKLKNNDDLNELENYFFKKLAPDINMLFLFNLCEKLKNNEKDFSKEELQTIEDFDIKTKKEPKNEMLKLAQVLWYDEGFVNLIPVPAVRTMSMLALLKERINETYKKEKANEYESKLIELNLDEKANKNKIKEIEKNLLNIDKEYVKGISKRIKSVASNAQNVSEYLSLKNGYLERFFSYKYIKQQSNFHERSFYKFDTMFFKNKIQNKALSSGMIKFLENQDLFFNLSNSVTKRLYKSLCVEIANKIIKDLAYFKKEFIKNKDKYNELKDRKEILEMKNTDLVLFQKYLLDISSEEDKTELSKLLIFKYEKINDLHPNLQEEIQKNIWIKI